MEEIKLKILKELKKNSRMSEKEIGERIGIPEEEVKRIIEEIKREGLIKQFTIKTDDEKLGYDFVAVIGIEIEKGKMELVEKRIAGFENITAVYDVTGEFDAFVIGKFKGKKDLDSFLTFLNTLEYVKNTVTFVVLNTIKEKLTPI